MPRKRWSAHELKEILGEPHTIGPIGHGSSQDGVAVATMRAVKIGNKELQQGETIGWMQWNCAGGDALEQHRQAFLQRIEAHRVAAMRGELAGPIDPTKGYSSCTASKLDEDDPKSWVMGRICRKHHALFGD